MKKKYKIQNTKYEKQRGFTVLETIVAILILSLAISGVFSAVQQSLSQSKIAKDEVLAFYLAQETMETVRNKISSNQVRRIKGASISWLEGLSVNINDPCYFGNVCKVDTAISAIPISPPVFTLCGSLWDDCSYLRQKMASPYYYTYYAGGTTATKIKKEIMVEQVTSDEIAVTVKISWQKGAITKDFKVKTHLFNWVNIP